MNTQIDSPASDRELIGILEPERSHAEPLKQETTTANKLLLHITLAYEMEIRRWYNLAYFLTHNSQGELNARL